MKRVDGYFDKVTVSSLKEFQVDNALEVTGVLDDDTANALNRAVLVKWNTQKDEVDTQLKAAIALFK
jgi:carboxyl-terminal processing protease